MTKKIIINHLLSLPCNGNTKFNCQECALRFTGLCEDTRPQITVRYKIKQNIETNTRGLDFISKERCQITVLKEELYLKRNESWK